MAEISVAKVDQAEAALAEAKEGGDPAEVHAAKVKVREIRQAWREQEIAAGRRQVGTAVGGDAEKG